MPYIFSFFATDIIKDLMPQDILFPSNRTVYDIILSSFYWIIFNQSYKINEDIHLP